MSSNKPFYTDGMTVEEILSLGDDILSKLDQRDMSRAVRTAALAANKRMNKLLAQAKKTKEGYVVKKSAQYNIALDALNSITADGTKKIKFSAKDKTRNELYHELSVIRTFMNMQTSTLKGAVRVRKEREKRTLGTTSEEYIKKQIKLMKKNKKLNKKQILKAAKEIRNYIDEKTKKAYELFRKFNEMKGIPNNPYRNYSGSDEVLEEIGQRTLSDEDDDDILDKVALSYQQMYEAQIEALDDEDLDPFTLIFGD